MLLLKRKTFKIFLVAATVMQMQSCGGIHDGSPLEALAPLEPCDKGKIRTSTRNTDGQEVLACLKKCWHDWQCVGDLSRCQESVCVQVDCLGISAQQECEQNLKCYWHKAGGPKDIARCSSGFDADISIPPPTSL